MKATAIASSNIAFIKYWGKKDEYKKIPENTSISMNLSDLTTTTTVEFSQQFTEDSVIINDEINDFQTNRVIKYLDLIRKKTKLKLKAKVVSVNSFPDGTGLSSSASGFAALSLAASKAAGLNLDEKELSILARLGSGSACRSIPDGFVEWNKGSSSETSFARSIYKQDYWDIVDVVVLVSQEKKEISSTKGQLSASTSPFFQTRLDKMDEKINRFKKTLETKNFTEFGKIIEEEALELHAIMLTSSPSLIYWQPETLKLMKLVKDWRGNGLESYFTLNTGQDIHIIVEGKNKEKLVSKLQDIKEVKETIINHPSAGARIIEKHLF